ncbi:MAG: nucleotidyltransferase domain-containing protein [Chloroflexi bacterium]|nr:nucleotidyltransferase domain-containing protein [Chloroflexota bacterium]
MNPIVKEQQAALSSLCQQRRVLWLALFGSAAAGRFNPLRSDLDFLVEFAPMSPREHADCYFGLLEDLQRLFQRSIDLVEPSSIQNPYFRQAVEDTQLVLYEAA